MNATNTLLGIFILYAMASVVIHYYSNFALFKPQTPSYKDDIHILKIPTHNGLTVSARYLPNPSARYTLLFSHGNRADIGLCLPLAEMFREHGFSVMLYDYPGYGTSTGNVSEKNTYAAIHAVYNYLLEKQKISSDKIILYGRSLGGGPSIELATQKQVGGLIVEGTFTSVYRIKSALAWLPFDKFQNIKKINSIKVPTLIIHGAEDEIIPIKHGQALYAHAKGKKTAFWVPNAKHATVVETAGDTFWGEIENFTAKLN